MLTRDLFAVANLTVCIFIILHHLNFILSLSTKTAKQVWVSSHHVGEEGEELRGRPSNPGLPGKWDVKIEYVCASVVITISLTLLMHCKVSELKNAVKHQSANLEYQICLLYMTSVHVTVLFYSIFSF